MALDGAYLHAVRQELLPLLDSRIEKIHQPTREELLVAFRGRKPTVDALLRHSGLAASQA